MNAEERLRAALADRAERARTSPDALDAVFGRVARHRRAVRLTAALSVACVAVAGAAFAAGTRPGTDAVRPITSAPATASPTTDEPTETATPSASPSATPTPEGAFVPVRVTFPDDTALVVLADRRVVAISTTTGAERATFGTLPPASADGPSGSLDWSSDRAHVVYEAGDCRLHRLDVANGTSTPLGRGRDPQIAADGRVAAIGCESGTDVLVIDPVTRRSTSYAARDKDATDDRGYPDLWERQAYVASVAWSGDHHLVVARGYEGALDVRIVDLATGKAFASDPADHVAVGRTTVAALHCCYPGENGADTTTFFTVPDVLDRRRPTPREETFTHPGNVHSLTLDARGAVLYVAADRLWRWSGGEPRLIRRGVAAVSG
ncbi:MAG TPA: hypothetical protein VNQ77_03025 [Frankiaceae bacterium]|nr:hypothetical protein [Frankiaceae bacterium]